MKRRAVWMGTVAAGALLLVVGRAAAEATDPPNATGGCTAVARVDGGETIDPYVSSGVYEIPLSGSAQYEGAVPGGGPDVAVPERAIAGEVVIKTPPLIPDITLTDAWSWDGSGTGTYDSGSVDWDLPSVLPRGVPFKVEGYHAENGTTICDGYVNVQIEGGVMDSPLAPISIGGTLIASLGLALAMINKGVGA